MGPAMSTVLTVAGPPSAARAASSPPVRLFGQFLVEEGIIAQDDLDEALNLMSAINVTLGDLAVERGLISRHEADEVNRMQRCIDGRWGEIALTLGIGKLTPERIEELHWQQESQNLRLTDALVQLGVLCPTEVDEYLEQFDAAQRSSPAAQLPNEWNLSCAQHLIEVLPRVFLRLLRSPVRFGEARPWDRRSLGVDATVCLETEYEQLTVGLSTQTSVANAFGRRLQRAVTGCTPAQNVLAFTTLMVEHVRRRLESQTHDRVITLPGEPNSLPQTGTALDLASSEGRSILVLHRVPRWGA